MRVAVISPTFPPMKSGGADYGFRLCQYLAEREVKVRIITSRIDDIVKDARMDVCPVMHRWSWVEMPRVLRLIRDWHPDVVNIHFSGAIYDDQPMVTFLPTI